MNVGKRIKQAREKLGLSADDLAAALDIDRSTVYRYESNFIEKLPTKILEPLAEILKTTPGYLMGWKDDITYLDDVEADEIIRRINDRAKEKGLDIDEVLSACNIEINSFVSFSKKAVSLADCLDCTVDYITGRSDDVNVSKLNSGEVSIDELLNTVGRKALIEELLKREED